MIVHSSGYVFEARIDCMGKKGMKENFSFFNNTATVLCGVDGRGKITRAITHIGRDGFVSLSDILKNDSDMKSYLKSHKATYALVGESQYLAKINYKLADKDIKVTIYIPQGDIPITVTGNKQIPGVVCKVLSAEPRLHSFTVSQKVYDSLSSGIIEQVRAMDWSNREKYLQSRM